MKHDQVLVLIASGIVSCIFISFWGLSSVIKHQPNSEQQIVVAHNHGHAHVLPKKLSPAQLHTRKAAGNPDDCYPRYPILSGDQVYHLVNLWFQANCPSNVPNAKSCKFHSIGRYLLNHAIKHDMTLLTVQIGAMDGKSNDPMFEMYVQKKNWPLRSKDHFDNLQNWLPVLLEPVPQNYDKLVKAYKEIHEENRLPCPISINAAISYDTHTTECKFCRFNVSPDAPQECSHADWMKTQMGTLDCEHSLKFLGKSIFDKCIIQDPLPCGPVSSILQKKAPYLPLDSTIAMVQIDVEAYEYIILEGLVKELNPLPPIIHFYNKVDPLPDDKKSLQKAIDSLEKAGYIIYEKGEDTLAFYLPYNTRQKQLEPGQEKSD
jgi:hypothetical protein